MKNATIKTSLGNLLEVLGGDKKYYCYAVDLNDWLK